MTEAGTRPLIKEVHKESGRNVVYTKKFSFSNVDGRHPGVCQEKRRIKI